MPGNFRKDNEGRIGSKRRHSETHYHDESKKGKTAENRVNEQKKKKNKGKLSQSAFHDEVCIHTLIHFSLAEIIQWLGLILCPSIFHIFCLCKERMHDLVAFFFFFLLRDQMSFPGVSLFVTFFSSAHRRDCA